MNPSKPRAIPILLLVLLSSPLAITLPACATRSTRRVAWDGMAPTHPPRRERVVPEGAIETLLEAHNEERARAKLPRLKVSQKLQAAAEAHARDMAERGKMEHKGGDGTTPFDRMKREGYRFRLAAENVAFGQYSIETLMDGWMNSPGHRKNILGRYTQVGMAYATDRDGIPYWCVTFGTPLR